MITNERGYGNFFLCEIFLGVVEAILQTNNCKIEVKNRNKQEKKCR